MCNDHCSGYDKGEREGLFQLNTSCQMQMDAMDATIGCMFI